MNRLDEQIEADVREEIFRDGRVEPREVAVRVRDGVVTLRGTVGSRAQRRAAGAAAKRVDGVVDVDDELQVEPMDMHGRQDAELRAQVLDALDANGLIPDTVDVRVGFGVVTLSGTVRDMFQREEAEFVARRVHGAKNVHNELAVEQRSVLPW